MNTKLYLLALAYNLNNLSFSPNQRTSFFSASKKMAINFVSLSSSNETNVVESKGALKDHSPTTMTCVHTMDNAGGYGFVVIEYKHGLPLSLILILGYT